MRKVIAALAVVAGLLGGYAILDSSAAPPAKNQQNPASQAIRKAAAKNPLDALSQAQSHTAIAYRSALARDGKATAKQLAEVMADLEAARPAVKRLDRALAEELVALRATAEGLKKRAGSDTGALVPEIANVFKGVKQLEAKVAAYSEPQTSGQPGQSGRAVATPPKR